MRKQDVTIGGTYKAKVSNQKVLVRILRESPYGGWDARNEKTGRTVRIRTAGRLTAVQQTTPKPAPTKQTIPTQHQSRCPGCSCTTYRETSFGVANVVRCNGCGGIYTLERIYLGDSYRLVKPQWDDTDCPAEKWQYFDFDVLGSDGPSRRHGFYNPGNRKITQVG